MNFFSTVLIAIGLAMDCFAVSISSGLVKKDLVFFQILKIAFFFGFFQAIMLVIGWFLGVNIRSLIAGVDHWIAFGLLSFVGGKMIFSSFNDAENEIVSNILKLKTLVLMSFATSIDAMAVGLSFSFLQIKIVVPVIVIGMTSFLLSILGCYLGKKMGCFLKNKLEIFGGLILIFIGLKILIEHLLSV